MDKYGVRVWYVDLKAVLNFLLAKVVVTDFLEEQLDHERGILGDLAEVSAIGGRHEDELTGRIEDADAVMVYHFLSRTRRTIERLQHCKLIVRCGAGVDHAFAATRGIAVANVPDYGTEEVADSAFGLALALARGPHQLNNPLRAGRGERSYTQAAPVWQLRGRVFGIVGIGRIGSASALRAKALGWTLRSLTPSRPTAGTSHLACGVSSRSTSCSRNRTCLASTARSRRRRFIG